MVSRPRAVATEHQAISTEALGTRVGPGSVLPDLLRDLGVEPQSVFDAAGVDIVRFADPETSIPLADAARLVHLSMVASGRLDLGLLLAGRAGEEVAGLLGRLVASAGDLRSALHDIVRYGHLNQREGAVTLTVSGNVATLRFALTGPFSGADIAFEDLAVGRFFRMIRTALGGTWRPTAVMLSHAPPPRVAASYRQFFGAPVRFNAVGAALEFPAADLERATAGGVGDRRAELETAASNASDALAIGFEEKVRWMIHARLSDPGLSVEQVAALNGMSRRSLNRRLAVRGVTFARLLRSVRLTTARRLLVESETPLSEIAAAIGYDESSVFSNAFRTWSGVSPREWRRQHGRG
jgi:AraC-like DNA-binding protein